MRGSPAQYANAKRRALKVLADLGPDDFVPDRVEFFNRRRPWAAFDVRLLNRSDGHLIEVSTMYAEIESANGPILEIRVKKGLAELAAKQGEKLR